MSAADFTLIDDGRVRHVPAVVRGEHVYLAPAAVETSLGWVLKPQGLCRDDVCLSVRRRDDLQTADGIELNALAALLDRPLAAEIGARAAYLGASAGERAGRLLAGDAPDFTLPDLNGKLHSLSDYRGKKVLLLAYASW